MYRSMRSFVRDARHNKLLAVPAGLYAINNYLKFAMQLYFKPTTAKMLGNLKVGRLSGFCRTATLKSIPTDVFHWPVSSAHTNDAYTPLQCPAHHVQLCSLQSRPHPVIGCGLLIILSPCRRADPGDRGADEGHPAPLLQHFPVGGAGAAGGRHHRQSAQLLHQRRRRCMRQLTAPAHIALALANARQYAESRNSSPYLSLATD